MSKNISLPKKLLSYSAATASFITTYNVSDAQVLYTDVADDTLYFGDTFPIDLNNDGIADFYLGECDQNLGYFYGGLIARGTAANAIAGVATYVNSYGTYNDYIKLPFKLNYFEQIGAGNSWVSPDHFNPYIWCNNANPYYHAWLNAHITSNQYGYWNQNFADGYLGLRITVNTDQYYGWVRLSVDTGASWIVIKDFALDTIAGETISAGDCLCPPTGMPELNTSSLFIFPNPSSDEIFISVSKNFPGRSQVSIYNLQGKKLLSEEISESLFNLDISTFPPGVYIAEVKSGEEVLLSKFAVQR